MSFKETEAPQGLSRSYFDGRGGRSRWMWAEESVGSEKRKIVSRQLWWEAWLWRGERWGREPTGSREDLAFSWERLTRGIKDDAARADGTGPLRASSLLNRSGWLVMAAGGSSWTGTHLPLELVSQASFVWSCSPLEQSGRLSSPQGPPVWTFSSRFLYCYFSK